MLKKLTSRKFWLSAAAFLGSMATAIAGLATQSEALAVSGMICAVISSGIYAVIEAAVDEAALGKEELYE